MKLSVMGLLRVQRRSGRFSGPMPWISWSSFWHPCSSEISLWKGLATGDCNRFPLWIQGLGWFTFCLSALGHWSGRWKEISKHLVWDYANKIFLDDFSIRMIQQHVLVTMAVNVDSCASRQEQAALYIRTDFNDHFPRPRGSVRKSDRMMIFLPVLSPAPALEDILNAQPSSMSGSTR